MKVLSVKQPFSAERAFDIYRELQKHSEQLFFRASIIAVVCLSIKYLGLELNELSLPGTKILISNPRIITGAFGWFTLFYASASAWKHWESIPYSRLCQHHIAATTPDPEIEGHTLSQTLGAVFLVLFLFLMAVIAITIYDVRNEMLYILNSAIGRITGAEMFIGPFETCVQPKPT